MTDANEYYPEEMMMAGQGMGPGSSDVYSAIIQEKRVENILEQLNPDKLIIEIEYRIKGYVKNQFSKKWELIGKKEKQVSDELISDLLSILSSILTNNTTLSNFTTDEINKIMKLMVIKLIDTIREKCEDYNLTNNYAERDRVMLICLNTVFSSLKRAQAGLESKRLFDSLEMKDTFQPHQAPQKSGLGRIFGV